MGAMVAAGNNTQSSSDSVQDNGTRIKRKFRPAEPRNPGHSDMTLPSYELFPEDIPGANIDLDVGQAPAGGPGEGLSLDKFCDNKWSDVMEAPLEELALHSLDALYRSAIKRIASCGYTKDVATDAVLRSSHLNGCKDIESNIADNALAFLKTGLGVDSLVRENLSEALRELEKKVLENMVAMLKEVRPSFSTGDAMWCLLICDMNLPHACEIDVNILNGLQDGDVLLDAPASEPEPSPTLSTPPIASEINVLGLEKSVDLLQSPSSETVLAAAAGTSVSHPGVAATSSNINGEDSYADPGQEHPMSSKEYIVAEFSYDESRSARRREKPVNSRKCLADGYKREYILQQTTIHLEKSYRGNGPNPYPRTVHKLSELGSMMSDKKFKLISKSSTVNSKNSSPQASIKVGMDTAGGDSTNNISFTARSFSKSYLPRSARTPCTSTFFEKCSASALHRANTEALLSPTSNSSRTTPKPNCSNEAPSSECSECSIQFDKIWGQLIPEEKKDETLSKLESRVQELQAELNGWTEWTQKRVMQAAHKLSKDKAELHTLREENEEVSRLYQEKLSLEENTIKKLTEMENALSKASGQVVNANINVRRLGIENAVLKQTMQDTTTLAEKSATTYQESSLREMDTLKKLQSEDRMKAMCHDEFATEKGKVIHLGDQLEQAKKYLGQLEVGRSQAEKVKEEALARAETDRKLQSEYRVCSKEKMDAMTANAENGLQGYRDDIRRLTFQIAKVKMDDDSLRMAAVRVDEEEAGSWDLNRDRECVMCMSEERSVLFLPCAHLVVCAACNQTHQGKGLQDCPSCRTPIQDRISVCSVDS